jgi:2-(1,2-epoxy-1,2-dihydrophenyl)acetyl-CoA isomerase
VTDQEAPADLAWALDDRGVATITFNRPRVFNALTSDMLDRLLPEYCARATADPAVRVVVLTGAGSGFCSGADVRERIPQVSARADDSTLERPYGAFAEHVWRLPKPVIAAVNGVAAGGGMSLAAAADFRFCGQSATFVPAFVRRGMMADSGITYTLPRLVGPSRAMRMLMTGDLVSAQEALACGLADDVVADDQLAATVQAFAERLADGPAVALSFIKRAVGPSARSDFGAQLELESWGASACFRSEDFAEGMRAFSQKRQPVFGGR